MDYLCHQEKAGLSSSKVIIRMQSDSTLCRESLHERL